MGLGQESGKGEGMVTDMLHGDITCVLQTSFSSLDCFGREVLIISQKYTRLIKVVVVIID